MRHALLALALLSALLSSCQSPRVTVLVQDLKPGMLRGRTVAVGGMDATFAAWPGRPIDQTILNQAAQALQRSLKSSRVQVLPADWIVHSTKPTRYDGILTTSTALDAVVTRYSKSHADQADYLFMFFLRKDNIEHIRNGGERTDFMNVSGRVRDYLWGSAYSWRGMTLHELKVDYLLYDTHANQFVWRAKTVHSDGDVSINSVGFWSRTPKKKPEWLPATPTERLWITMNNSTAKTLP